MHPSLFRSTAWACLMGSLLLPLSLSAQYYGIDSSPERRWSLGLLLGSGILQGDVAQNGLAWQGGLRAEYGYSRALGFSLQAQQGSFRGLDLSPSQGFRFDPARNGFQNPSVAYDSGSVVYYNYQSSVWDLSASAKLYLNRLFTRDGGERWDLYLGAGIGALFYRTFTDAWQEDSESLYDFSQIPADDPFETEAALLELLDGTYESYAERDPLSRRFGDFSSRRSFHACAGLRFRVQDRIALGLDGRIVSVRDDLLDGRQWTEENLPSPDNERLIFLSLSLDFLL
jgi:hypothetical protein